jgi:hypothetical protein
MTMKWMAALALVFPLCAQMPIAGIRSWTGTVKMTAQGNGVYAYGKFTDTWSVDSGAEFKVKVDWTDKGAWYLGRITEGRVTVRERYLVTGPSSSALTTYTGEANLRNDLDGEARAFALYVSRKGQYRLGHIDPIISVIVRRPHDTLTWQAPWLQTIGVDPEFTPPNPPTRLKGSYEMPGRAFFLLAGTVRPEFSWKVEYDLVPDQPAEELEVLVSSADYSWWRPAAGAGGSRGNTITMTAELQKKGGGEPPVKAKTFEWRFTDTSRVPGYAMNMPKTNPQMTPDMRFEPSDTLKVLDSEGQMAEATPGQLVKSDAVVGSWDWGGYGELEVTAVLEDGRRIQGKLKGTGEPAILLPRRTPGDTIAKSWRDAYGAGSRPDSADDENSPVGDGHQGDGLTLYEEYRGFIEKGEHVDGSVDTKDFFIFNRAGAAYVPGIKLFEKLTGLKVHFELTEEEAGEFRMINRNAGEAPHRVDQHLVEIRSDSGPREVASAIGGPGNPILIDWVIMPAVTGQEEEYLVVYYAKTLAHELLHAVNVWHHGDGGDKTVKWLERDGVIYEVDLNGRGQPRGEERPIRVLRENGNPARITIPPEGVSIWLGSERGTHSGADTCVMRYDASDGYVSRSDEAVRYYVVEKSGSLLCDTDRGTGVNDAARTTPQPRYGDPDAGRGRCIRQILVNDAVKAPRR